MNLWQHPGARWGIAWLAFLATIAAWAPFLANSMPLLLISAEGMVSSPVLSILAAEDLAWVSGWCAALWAGWRWRRARLAPVRALATVITAAVLAGGIGMWTLTPPEIVRYDEYRAAAANARMAVWAPIPYSPRDYLRDYGMTAFEAPLAAAPQRYHLFGTDEHGADVAARLIHATRTALAIGFIATGVALVIGVVIGALMGYFAGWVDLIGMRMVEIFEAIPTLFLLLTFVAFFERSLPLMMLIIGLTSWSGYARYTRAEFLKLRQIEFVHSAVVAGLPLWRILFRHMLPNAVAPLVVAAAFGVASAILAEATLSFLGLGLVDEPSWGQLLNQAVRSASFHWWLAVFPGGAIFLTVLAYNLIGEALRDVLDPRRREELAR